MRTTLKSETAHPFVITTEIDMPEPIASAIHQTEKLGTLWCALMHDSPMWPIHGEYECRTCGRHYPVPWAAETMVER